MLIGGQMLRYADDALFSCTSNRFGLTSAMYDDVRRSECVREERRFMDAKTDQNTFLDRVWTAFLPYTKRDVIFQSSSLRRKSIREKSCSQFDTSVANFLFLLCQILKK